MLTIAYSVLSLRSTLKKKGGGENVVEALFYGTVKKSISESSLKLLLTCWDLEFYIRDTNPIRG